MNMSLQEKQEQNTLSLAKLPAGASGIIISVPDNPLMYPLGLRPGKELQCRGHQIFGGPLLIRIGDRQIALSRTIAENVIVSC